MKPKHCRITYWDGEPSARCDEHRFSVNNRLPGEYRGVLQFRLGDGGKAWHDVLCTAMGILLFSEKVVNAFSEDGIVGMRFYEAEISHVFNDRLAKKTRPKYFWGRGEGLIDYDQEAYDKAERTVPVGVDPLGQDIYHVNYPDARRGYACNLRVLDTFRRHKVSNLWITPLDYYQVDKMDFFTPPFRIDVLAKKWPPSAWYPDGFEPHPNNLALD